MRNDKRFSSGRGTPTDRQGDRSRALFTKLVRDKDALLKSADQAKKFIKGMASFDSKAELLAQLDDNRNVGKRRIRDVLSFINSLNDVSSLFIPMLEQFMTEETNRPVYRPVRDRILFVIYNFHEVLNLLEEFNVASLLDTVSANHLCLLFRYITKAYVEPRQSEPIISMAKLLRKRGDISEASILCSFLLADDKIPANQPVKVTCGHSPQTPLFWRADTDPPGGRHDNDHRNYRNIQIVPTVDELISTALPYLPLATGDNKFLDDPVASLLDRNFRLLRDDAVSTMKETLNNDSNRFSWEDARIIGVDVNSKSIVSFVVQCNSGHVGKSRDRNRVLMPGSVISLSCNGVLKRLGTVTVREDNEEWLAAKGGPKIGVSFFDDEDIKACLDEMIQNFDLNVKLCDGLTKSELNKVKGKMKTFDLKEVSKSFFAYSPILQALQSIDRVQLLDDLVGQHEGVANRPTYLQSAVVLPTEFGSYRLDLDVLSTTDIVRSTTLDKTQADALLHALNSKIAMVQGPPGTGKTFIGALVARTIRENTDATILCVCYTNHALDQFLEHMLASGETRLVRIGSRSKSESLQAYSLWNLARNEDKGDDFDQRRIKQVTAQIHGLKDEIDAAVKDSLKPCSWKEMEEFLVFDDPDVIPFLRMPVSDDGFTAVGSEDFLWKRWKKGLPFPPWIMPHLEFAEADLQSFEQFWNLSREDRHIKIDIWRKELRLADRDKLLHSLAAIRALAQEKKALCQGRELKVLKEARVIGATTSGAAGYGTLISAAAPAVILVEEAGEVLEAHVLTSLSKSTEHLILIGDHKQLPPKVEQYRLTTTSGRGYNLDCSLFERLIRQGYPSVALEVQHRMRPSISALVRQQTYPNLIDHQSVFEYGDVKGVTKNVVFIDHLVPENGDESEEYQTKSNLFEAEFAIEIVRFLLLQGYSMDRIVVLTPYLGQLVDIVRIMKVKLKDTAAQISDRDHSDLLALDTDGPIGLETQSKVSQGVRCSSVDNFQGEEADIIVATLVRSNTRGSIGFLKEPQRVNVLLSRARHGMFIIGNSSTLLATPPGRVVWKPILDQLSREECVLTGLPTYCQLHPKDDPVVLANLSDFRDLRPNGGCLRPCTVRLGCGHACPMLCHSVDRSHRQAKDLCSEPCRRFPPGCSLEHSCPKLCKDECGHCFVNVGPTKLLCNHFIDARCFEISSATSIERLSKKCTFPVTFAFPNCGHEANISCIKSQTDDLACEYECRKSAPCGHPCSNLCGSCLGNHKCKERCAKVLFCGHTCNRNCHAPEECSPCTELCANRCPHSTCMAVCSEPCSSCVEPCDWQCEHRGQCPLVCGAPCSRLPCNERCEKKLGCGHQCPSLCGEGCPTTTFCQVCTETKRESIVDMINFTKYEDHDIDEDPIIVLSCEHFFATSTLDGLLQIRTVYGMNNTGLSFTGLLPVSGNNLGREKPKQCPTCRTAIHSIRRYGRVLRLTELRSLERKHVAKAESVLDKFKRRIDRDTSDNFVGKLLKIEQNIRASPMRKVFEACGGKLEFSPPPPAPLLHCIELQGIAYAARTSSFNDDDCVRAIAAYESAIAVADVSLSSRSGASLRIALGEFIARHCRDIDICTSLVMPLLEWVFDHTIQFRELAAKAQDLKAKLTSKEFRMDEFREVAQAMSATTGYNYGGSASSHWFECRNGHPFFIGDCGGAMETSFCPECREPVGGNNHALLASNRAVTGDFREALE